LIDKYCNKLQLNNLTDIHIELENVEEYIKQKIQGVEGLEKLTIINGLFKNFSTEDDTLVEKFDKISEYINDSIRIYKNIIRVSSDPYAAISGWEVVKFLLNFIDKLLSFFQNQFR